MQTPLSSASKAPSAAHTSTRLTFSGVRLPKSTARHVRDTVIISRAAAEDTAAEAPPAQPRETASRIKLSALSVGQTMTGTVRTIQPYGCFVDIGAESNGLVHISQMADGFVEDVNAVVQVGGQVTVRVLTVEGDKRVSLTMRSEDAPERAPRRERGGDRESRPAGGRGEYQQRAGERRDGGQRRGPREPQVPKHSLKVGDELTATVVRTVGFGCFLACEDGFEVLMPTSEMQTDGAIAPNPRDYVKEGESIPVTVVKVDGNKVAVSNITAEDRKMMKEMDTGVSSKKEERNTGGSFAAILSSIDYNSLPSVNPSPPSPVVEEAAPAPVVDVVEAPPAPVEAVAAEPVEDAVEAAPAAVEEAVSEPVAEAPPPAEAPKVEAVAPPAEAPKVEAAAPPAEAPKVEAPVVEATPPPAEPAEVEAAAPPAEAPKAAAPAGASAKDVKALREESGAAMMDCKKALVECKGDMAAAKDWLRKKGLASANKKAGRIAAEGAIVAYIHTGARLGILAEVNCETDFVARGSVFKTFALDMAMQVAACPDVTIVSPEDFPADQLAKEKEIEMGKEDIMKKPEAIREKMVQGRLAKITNSVALMTQPYIKDDSKLVSDFLKETISSVGENMNVRRFVRFNLGEGLKKKEDNFAQEVQEQMEKKESAPKPAAPAAPSAQEEAVPTVAVNAKAVKELREITGCGMMDCKKALAQNNNDIEIAQEWLRKRGLASAGKKAGRIASEGAVGTYIHAGSRLGVLIEVNCETDFVSKGDLFKALVKDMAMQVAACPDVQFVSTADVDEAFIVRELEVELQKEDLLSKPEKMRPQIAQGRVNKLIAEKCLLNQPFIKEPTKTVEQVVKEAIATIGENISVRRFARFNLGEGIEKKKDDFAAEVAAATGGN